MDRKVRDTIFNEIKASGRLEKDYVVGLVKTYEPLPDVNKLIEQSYKSKADRIISKFKDENGIRDCFAVKTADNKTKYIDLTKADLLELKDIDTVIAKQLNSNRSRDDIIKKAKISRKVKMGQIRKEDYKEALKEELSK